MWPVSFQVTPDVPHVFQGSVPVLDEARQALDTAGTFLAERLDRPSRSEPPLPHQLTLLGPRHPETVSDHPVVTAASNHADQADLVLHADARISARSANWKA